MSGGSDGGSAIRKQEEARQASIKQGMSQINAIFGGGQYGVNPVKAYDPAGSYYTASGDAFKYDPNSADVLNWLHNNPGVKKGLSGGSGSGFTGTGTGFRTGQGGHMGGVSGVPVPHPSQHDYLQQEYIKNLVATGQLFSGVKTTPGFNDAFYNQRATQFQDFALPQLARQYKQQQDQLMFGQANHGTTLGNTAQRQNAGLAGENAIQKQGIADQGLTLANQTRTDVENQRQQLVAQLNASADPFGTSQLAIGSATRLNAPQSFAPLGNMFSNWANIYGNNQINQQYGQGQYGMYGQQNRLGGLPNILGSSSRIVGG